MARKKTETISLRVNPVAKHLLEGMSAFQGKTATEIVEDLIADAAMRVQVDKLGDVVADFRDVVMDLYTIVHALYVENDPILTKLRIFFVAPTLVTERDKVIISTILDSIETFEGDDQLFDIKDESSRKQHSNLEVANSSSTPRVDLEKIRANWEFLEEYVLFRTKNKNLNLSFPAFLSMRGKG